MNKTKCLLITSIFPPTHGGSAIVYENICRFSPHNTIHVLAPKKDYTDGKQIEGWQAYDASAPYPVHRIELIRPLMVQSNSLLHSLWLLLSVDIPLRIRVFLKVRNIVREEKINVICIGELVSTSWVGILAKRWLGCKVINYIHGEEITTTLSFRHFKNRRQYYLKQADAIIAVSDFTRETLIRQMDANPNKIHLITNGVNLSKFYPQTKSASLQARYKLENKQIILTVGRLIPRKGIDTTIKALPQILKKCPNAHYLVVGTGEFRSSLEKLAKTLGVSDNVTFTGRIENNELTEHYSLCDLFVMPNREMDDHDTEGFGLVFLEANACGKAVVGGRAGGVIEAVQDGNNGLLVDGTNTDEVANTIATLLCDNTLRKKIEAQGLIRANASSSEIRAHQFLDVCDQITKEI